MAALSLGQVVLLALSSLSEPGRFRALAAATSKAELVDPKHAFVVPKREGCWLRGVCRVASRLEEGPWQLDPVPERYGLGRPSHEERRCLARAAQLWAACGNTELEGVSARYSPTGATLTFPTVHPEAAEQWGVLESFAHYQMSYMWRPSVNQFSDADVAPPLRECAFDNGVDWPGLQLRLAEALGINGDDWSRDPIAMTGGSCRAKFIRLQAGLGNFAEQSLGAWAVSDATSDCFLGMLSLILYDVVCSHLVELESQEGAFGRTDHYQRVDRTIVSLEGLFFHMQAGGDPAGGALEALVQTKWPVLELLEALTSMFRQTFGRMMPSLCDQRDDATADAALRKALAVHFSLGAALGEAATEAADWRLAAAEPRPPWSAGPGPCAWRQVCVLAATAAELLSTARSQQDAWPRAAHALAAAEHWFRSWDMAAEPLDIPLLGDAGAGFRQAKAPRLQFFYDMLTSEWPIFSLLRRVSYEFAVSVAAVSRRPVRDEGTVQTANERIANTPLPATLFVCRGDECNDRLTEVATSASRELSTVLFLGGGENTPQWAAFSLRGRQVARALRVHGRYPAQVWQHNCDAFCDYLHTGHVLVRRAPTSEGAVQAGDVSLRRARLLVHVKFVCLCALRLLPQARHILDVVDNSAWVNEAINRGSRAAGADDEIQEVVQHGERTELDVDGVIVESRAGAAALASLPLFKRHRVPVISIPHGTSLAHASMRPRSEEEALRPVRLIAVHTTHWDPVYERVQRFVQEEHPGVRFAHWSPATLLGGAEGDLAARMISPTQLRRVQAQLSEVDLTFVKQSGCISEPDFCALFKPGQRLLHAWAAGVPSIIVLGNSSPIRDYLFPDATDAAGAQQYPPEAVVKADGCDGSTWHRRADGSEYAEVFCDGDSSELLLALGKAIRDAALRVRLRAVGLARAARWSPQWVAQEYGMAFREVEIAMEAKPAPTSH